MGCLFTILAAGTVMNNINGNTAAPLALAQDEFCTQHDLWPTAPSLESTLGVDINGTIESYKAIRYPQSVHVCHTFAAAKLLSPTPVYGKNQNATYVIPDVPSTAGWQLSDYCNFVAGNTANKWKPPSSQEVEASHRRAENAVTNAINTMENLPESQGAGSAEEAWTYGQFLKQLKHRDLGFHTHHDLKTFHGHVKPSSSTKLNVNAVYRDLGPGTGKPNQESDANLWTKLGLDKSEWAEKNKEKLEVCVDRNGKLFEFLTKPPFVDKKGNVVEVPIHLKDDVPVCQRAYRLNPERLALLDEYLDELLELGVIRPTTTSEYSSVVVLVPKPDGSQRVCCDYRCLNKKIKKYAFNATMPQDIYDCCYGAELFSTCDVSKAFYNLAIAEKDDCLLLPYGKQDFVCKVQSYDDRSGMVRFQYMNTEATEDRKAHYKLALAWANSNDENDEIYTTKLPPAAVKKGYAAKGDNLHKDEFYQIPVKLQIDKKHPTRFFLAKHLKIQAKAAKAIA